MRSILLVTERFDPTADLIIAELRRREIPYFRWNLDQFPVGSSLTYRASKERFATRIVADGRNIDLDAVGSIWWRGGAPRGLPDTVSGTHRQFAVLESRLAVQALAGVGRFTWFNHPHHQ